MAEAASDGAPVPVGIEGAADLVIHVRRLGDQASSDPARAEAEIRSAIGLAEGTTNPEALALALRAMAVVHRLRWEQEDALRLLDRAVRIAARHGLRLAEAEIRGTRAVVRQDRGDASGARRDIAAAKTALAGASDVADDECGRLTAYLDLQLAVIAHNAGHHGDAEERYRRLAESPHLSDAVALRLANNLALALAARGAYSDALEASERAVALATAQGPAVAAMARQTHAWIVVREGRLAEGMAEFDEVAEVYQHAGMSLGEYDIELADAMADLRLLPEAIAAAQAAVDEFAEAQTWLMWVEAQVRLARMRLAVGDARRAGELAAQTVERSRAQRRVAWTDRARLVGVQARLALSESADADAATARRAAARFERAGDLVDAAQAYLVAGRAALATGRPAAARSAFAAAGRIAEGGPLLLRVRGHLALATAARMDGDRAGVVREARTGLRDLATHRSSLPTMELRALASGHGAELGEMGLAALLGDGTPAQVLRWMEQTRAAAILARLPVLEPGADDAPAWSQPTGSPAASGGVPATEPDPLPLSRVDGDGAWTSVPSLATMRAGLDGRVLVETGLCEGRYVAVVVRPRGIRTVDLGPREAIEEPLHALVFALRRLASPRSSSAAQAARVNADARLRVLRERLVAPLGVRPDDELVVAPVGPLHGVPWSALHEGPVSLAPSATTWLSTAAAPVPLRRGRTVLVAGPGLLGAQDEVDALAAVHPAPLVFSAADSLVAPVTQALATADLAHLACHGVPRADNPMFSSLVLADGPVTVQELHRAGVAPRRLVLASCHSGADVAYAGDEVLGFVAGMLAGGTAGLVANIAAVPDVEVVDLMVALHRRLTEGRTMARALHAARAEVDRDTPAGFVNWCTFGAHGAA